MLRLACIALLLPSLAAAQGKVWVVSPGGGPGVDFTAIQPAVDAAAEGDTIRIQSGSYAGPIVIDGKGLTLVGNVSSQSKVKGLRVINLVAGQRVLLQGLTVLAESTVPAVKLTLKDNAGTVWVQECTMPASPGGETRITRCDEVILVRSAFSGGISFPSFWSETDMGVFAVDSSVHAYDCAFIGGPGHYDGWKYGATSGGRGFWLRGGFLFASDCTFIGGPAGHDPTCSSFTSGGDGLFLDAGSTAPSAKTLGCTFQAGADDPVCGAWLPALPVKVWAGEHEALSGTPCALFAGDFVTEGGILTTTFQGTPDAPGLTAVSFEPAALFLLPALGSVHLAPPYAIVLSAQLSPAGSLSLDLPVGLLPPGIDSLVVFAQLGLILPGGAFQLCSGSALTILDEQF